MDQLWKYFRTPSTCGGIFDILRRNRVEALMVWSMNTEPFSSFTADDKQTILGN